MLLASTANLLLYLSPAFIVALFLFGIPKTRRTWISFLDSLDSPSTSTTRITRSIAEQILDQLNNPPSIDKERIRQIISEIGTSNKVAILYTLTPIDEVPTIQARIEYSNKKKPPTNILFSYTPIHQTKPVVNQWHIRKSEFKDL